ncbi:23889_t:CDS:1, partial [Dentiscutata erythropus]
WHYKMFRISKFFYKYSKESSKKEQNLPSLPCEFILPIICHLSNDKKSLCSCLLVNRFWCQETIKVLWCKPFKLLYTCKKKPCFCSTEKRRSQAANLLSTYLSCILLKYKDSYIQNKSNFKISSAPLFYYIDYLNDIDLNELYSAVEDWIKFSSNKKRISADILKFQKKDYLKLSNERYNYVDFMKFLTNSSFGNEILPKYSGSSPRDLMVHIVVKAFMTQCPKLERVSIDSQHIYTREQMEYFCSTLKKERILRPENLPVEIYETLSSYTGNGPCLDQLTELICTTRRWKSTLLLSLAKFAHNIKYLIITISYQRDYFVSDPARIHELPKVEQEASCLATLVQSQKALKHFGLHICSEGLPTIMSALESQVISLNSISFVDVTFFGLEIFDNIRNFKNLRTLSIKSSSFDNFEFSFSLNNLEFSFLKELDLNGTYISAEVLEK